MILTKKVEVKINNSAINYYKNLGYNVKTGQVITIPIKHLSKGSNIKIKVQCQECDKINTTGYSSYNRQIKKHGYYTCKGICSTKKIIKTSLEKYGTKNPAQSDKVKNITKKNNMKKYNVEYIMQIDEFKNKMINTMFNRYGVSSFTQTEEYIIKTNETNMKKYGVPWSLQSENNKTKSKQTKKELYGNENYNNPEKRDQTNIERYGVNTPLQNKDIKNKIEISNIKKYGSKYPITTPEIKQKSKNTLFKNFGVKNTWDSKEISDKGRKTKKELYGDENYNNPEKISKTLLNKTEEEKQISVKKRKKTKEKLYGDPNYSNRKQSEKTCLKKYGVKNVSQDIIIYKKILSKLFTTKNYILPSGKIVKIQGYENIALDLLLKIYNENVLVVEDKKIEDIIGKIYYIRK